MKKIIVIGSIIILIVVVFFIFNNSGPTGSIVENTQTSILTTGETKEFDIIARQWQFSPDTIEVNQGDRVILNVKSIDVAHGLAIREFGINEYLSPGQTTKIEFTADRKGTYSFFCSVSCGVGHSRMRGTLIIN